MWVPWLVLSGCADGGGIGGNDHAACDALLFCSSIVNPFLVRDFEAAYGAEGACWGGDDDEACAQACEDGLTGLWIEYDHDDSCDPSAFIEPGDLTAAQFFEEQENRFCDALVECVEGHPGCNDYTYNGNPDNCEEYDPIAADVCLSQPYTCGTSPYNPYPVAPSVCADVCGD